MAFYQFINFYLIRIYTFRDMPQIILFYYKI